MRLPPSPRSSGSINDGDDLTGRHTPVFLSEAIAALAIRPGGLYVDATYGAGGHSRAIVAAGGRVVAFDRDPNVVVAVEFQATISLVRANFSELASHLAARGVERVDGVLFDFGVSSMQLDHPERGFSFRADGPLDMRMGGDGPTALDLLAERSESELAELIFTYGEERASRRIARAIVAARDAGRLPVRTLDLARLIAGVVHVSGRRERIHPATRTFQALRIAVNAELPAIEAALAATPALLRPGGRIAAIAFHSLEDRLVKVALRSDERLRVLTKKPLIPSDAERAANPRARSAKLRVAERRA